MTIEGMGGHSAERAWGEHCVYCVLDALYVY